MTPTEERALLQSVVEEYRLYEEDINGNCLDADKLKLLWLAREAELGRKTTVRNVAASISSGHWNPMHHSGDCLELAAHLKLATIHYVDNRTTGNGRVEVISGAVSVVEFLEYGSERLAATRLAVTRAAAEIGRRMT